MARRGRIDNRKSSKRGRRVARTAPAQSSSNGFSQRAHVPTRYPLFPRQFQFCSNWNRTVEVDLSGSQFTLAIGLFDFLGHIPEYALEMYNLYRYCRIAGVDVRLSVVGEADEANQNFSFEAAMAKIPFDQVGITPVELKLVRGSKYMLVPTSGMNRCILSGHYGSFDELGNPALDRQFWQDQTEANNATPSDTSRPVICTAVRVINGNRAFAAVNVSVTYHMQWFELEYKRIPNSLTAPTKTAKEQVSNNTRQAVREKSRAQQDQSLDFDEISEKPAPKRK